MSRLSYTEKAGFSSAEIGGSGLWQIMMIFLPVFYTDHFGVSAAAVGTLLFIVRIFDAVNDPIMGMIADRTKTRWGRFRPYLLWIAIPFGLMSVAMFWAPSLSDGGKVVYAYVTYIGMMIIYTAVMIPVSALSGVMTSDPQQRTQLNMFRFLLAFAAAMLVQRLTLPSVKFFGGDDTVLGFRVTIAIFACLSVIGFWIAFATTKERIKPIQEGTSKIMDDLKDLMKNKPWVIILTVSIITLIYVSIRSAAQMYYFKYYIGNEDMVSSFMFWGTAAIMVGIFMTSWLTKLLDKKRLFMVCVVLNGLSTLGFYVVAPDDIALLYFLQIFSSFVNGPTMPLLWSMMADSADYSEWKSGRRATGLVFSASTFAFKAGGALGGAISMFVLSFYGYEANVEQTAETLEGMKQMMSWYPGVGALLCAVILAFYTLDAQKMEEINKELAQRKETAGGHSAEPGPAV